MLKSRVGHVSLLIVAGWIVARIPQGLSVIPGTKKFWSTVFCILAIWTITSLVSAFAYIGGRKLFGR